MVWPPRLMGLAKSTDLSICRAVMEKLFSSRKFFGALSVVTPIGAGD
jgi:hypothetical protein